MIGKISVRVVAGLLCLLLWSVTTVAQQADWERDLRDGDAAYRHGNYAEAERLYKRALATNEKTLGAEHLQVAYPLNKLAILYSAQRRFTEAEPLYKRALAILEKALGPEDPNVATVLDNLARLYRAQEKHAEAESLYKRALAIREKAFGPNDARLATNLHKLALFYLNNSQYAKAEPFEKRALVIREKKLNPDDPDLARSLFTLARVYEAQGQYAEAEPLYKRALAINEKAFGPEHPRVATTLKDLAHLYYVQRRYAEAAPLYQRALAIREKTLGADHFEVIAFREDLASLLKQHTDAANTALKEGNFAEAERHAKWVLAIREEILGQSPDPPGFPDSLKHPDLADSLKLLADVYTAQGRSGEAEVLEKRAVKIWERALWSVDQPNRLDSLYKLAKYDASHGHYDSAEAIYKELLRCRAPLQIGPGESIEWLCLPNVRNELAELYIAQHRYAEAEPLYEEELTFWREVDAREGVSERQNTIAARNNLERVYRAQGKNRKADRLLRERGK